MPNSASSRSLPSLHFGRRSKKCTCLGLGKIGDAEEHGGRFDINLLSPWCQLIPTFSAHVLTTDLIQKFVQAESILF